MRVLHLASGSSHKRAELRAAQGAMAAAIAADEMQAVGDDDYLVLGDLNTAREGEELGGLDAAFAGAAAFDRQDNASGCSAYWVKSSHSPRVRPSWIDHVYLSGLGERDGEVPFVSGAHCAERLCQPFESTDRESGSSFYDASDHCPVYFELRDADED